MEVIAAAASVVLAPSLMGWLCCRRPGVPAAPDVPIELPPSPTITLLEEKPPIPDVEVFDTESPPTLTAARSPCSEEHTVKVEVHSSSSGAGSDENMSSSDLSERGSGTGSGGGGEHDYEDIYMVRAEAGKPRSRSRDSGSHSRSASLSSTHSNVVVHTLLEENTQPELPPLNTSQKSHPAEINNCDDQYQKSKTKLNHSHSMPYHPPNSRALKRVVSEPGAALPPPPPPPPPEELSPSSSPDTSIQSPDSPQKPHRSHSQSSHDSTPDNTSGEDTTLRASSASPDKSDSPDLLPSTPTGSAAVSSTTAAVQEAPHGPNLVNKQMVLPFIPPKFPSSGDGDEHSLIKPSEYLRALGTKPAPAPPPKVEPLPIVHSFQADDKTGGVVSAGPPPPPLPELPVAVAVTPAPVTRKADQPLGTISIQDLNSVQLRRTTKLLSKTMSAPPSSLSGPVEGPFQVAKQDLIEELKKSKDITGIKKMKVEKVKMEEQHEKELVTEIAKQLSVDSFVEKIPEKDATGNPIPPWKRQMLAKKAAEKARKEMEEALARQAEEKRLQSIPAWKRQLLQAKKPDEKPIANHITPAIEEKKTLPTIQIIENNTTKMKEIQKENKENSKPVPVGVHKDTATLTAEEEEGPTQIIPWRAQLRKTNSTLNLLE